MKLIAAYSLKIMLCSLHDSETTYLLIFVCLPKNNASNAGACSSSQCKKGAPKPNRLDPSGTVRNQALRCKNDRYYWNHSQSTYL